tara:strand:- start:309 stop:518 length:210 start_codon:yes stop_codon:yes gene_type:complete
MLVTMDEHWEPTVKDTSYWVVSKKLPLKLDIIVNCTSSKIGQNEYLSIEEIKNFLRKAFQLSHGLGFLK